MLNFLKAYGADWDYDHASPIEALAEGLHGISPQLAASYLVLIDFLERSPIEDALNYTFESPSEFESFLDTLKEILTKCAQMKYISASDENLAT